MTGTDPPENSDKKHQPSIRPDKIGGTAPSRSPNKQELHLVLAQTWSRVDGLRTFVKHRTRTVATLDVRKAPGDPALLSVISAGLGLGIAGNCHRLGVESILLKATFPVHPLVSGLFRSFENLQGGDVLNIRLEATEEVLPTDMLPTSGVSVALSAGKDCLYALERARNKGLLTGRATGVFVSGISPDYRHEGRGARRLAHLFGLRLKIHHFQFWSDSRLVMLRPQLRGMWRELVTIPLARTHGHQIVTGLNGDAMFHAPETFSNSRLYFSELSPTIRILEEVLDCRVSTVPGESEVYQSLRKHPFFEVAVAGSCWSPEECTDGTPCPKCRVFAVYDQVDRCGTMSREDADFWLSQDCIGDPALDEIARRVLAAHRRRAGTAQTADPRIVEVL